mgnify:CR=1 FL=1
MRVFYAHSSGDPLKDIEESKKQIKALITEKIITEKGYAPAVNVVSGRDDHRRHWRGDWAAWQESVLARKNALTGEPVYSMFVIKSEYCGKATANILGAALTMQRPVFYWDGNGAFSRIQRIDVQDPENWTMGFRVCREPQQLPIFQE